MQTGHVVLWRQVLEYCIATLNCLFSIYRTVLFRNSMYRWVTLYVNMLNLKLGLILETTSQSFLCHSAHEKTQLIQSFFTWFCSFKIDVTFLQLCSATSIYPRTQNLTPFSLPELDMCNYNGTPNIRKQNPLQNSSSLDIHQCHEQKQEFGQGVWTQRK